MRTIRLAGLALLVMLAACVTPSRSEQLPSPTQSTQAGDRAPDVLYVRQAGNGSPSYITVIDARSGGVLRALPDGIVSADRLTVYAVQAIDGGTRTRIRAIDAGAGTERRAYSVDGAYVIAPGLDGPSGLSADGRWLVLQRSPIKIDGAWVNGFVVVDSVTGAVAGRLELRGASNYGFFGIAPDGRTVFLTEYGDSATHLRAYDVASAAPVAILAGPWDGTRSGFVGAPIASPDGTRETWLELGTATGFIQTLDLSTRVVVRSALPESQRSTDMEKALLWSLVGSPDGMTVYAVNPALGVIDELDPLTATLRRTHGIAVSRTGGTVLDIVAQLFIRPADAKRYIRGGAVLSPDGRTLYAAGTNGIAVVDTASLSSRATWMGSDAFNSLTLSPDGARLYAISDQTGKIEVVRTSDGTGLGDFRTGAYPGEIVRIDVSPIPGSPAPVAAPAACGAYAAPDPTVAAEIQHLKSTATVIDVTSPCTVRVTIAGGIGTLAPFIGRTVILRATTVTTFATATAGDLAAIGALGLKPGDTFTLSFDSRAFPDGTYPLNFLNR